METMIIIGMECPKCATRIQRAIEKIGATDVSIDYKKGIARFNYSKDLEDIKFAVFEAGYDVE